jgi:hypothetical protein
MGYKIIFDGYEEPEIYDTYEEAEEAALVMLSDFNQGCIDLYLSNPGDYTDESDGNTGFYKIIKV